MTYTTTNTVLTFIKTKLYVCMNNQLFVGFCRHSSIWIEDYKDNLHKFFNKLRTVLPEESLIIWNLTMPLGESIRGGFLVPEVNHAELTGHMICWCENELFSPAINLFLHVCWRV